MTLVYTVESVDFYSLMKSKGGLWKFANDGVDIATISIMAIVKMGGLKRLT